MFFLYSSDDVPDSDLEDLGDKLSFVLKLNSSLLCLKCKAAFANQTYDKLRAQMSACTELFFLPNGPAWEVPAHVTEKQEPPAYYRFAMDTRIMIRRRNTSKAAQKAARMDTRGVTREGTPTKKSQHQQNQQHRQKRRRRRQ